MGGGFPAGSSMLVSGKIGTGKSIFAMQYVVKGVTDYGDLGVLFSLERDKKDLYRDASAIGLHLQRFERDGTLQVLGGSLSAVSMEMRKAKAALKGLISEIVETVKTSESRRVALERIDLLSMFSPNESDFKVQLSDLRERLAELNCTSVMTSEITEGKEELSSVGAEIPDGAIVLYYEGEGLTRDRTLEIRRMRGTEHSNRLHFFDITDKGIVIKEMPKRPGIPGPRRKPIDVLFDSPPGE